MSALGARLLAGAESLLREQLVTGEIPTYRDIESGGKLYAPSPFLSALAHDALAPLVPGPDAPPWVTAGALAADEHRALQGAALHVRRRIRAFLAWQEEPDGSWRFHGRASGLDPDAATTACAATALRGHAGERAARRRTRALRRFRSDDGRFHTFRSAEGRTHGFDRIANLHVLRCLSEAGERDGALAAFASAELAAGALEEGSPEHPDPVCFAHAAARACALGLLGAPADAAARLVPWLLARQQADGGFGGPLATALAAWALADLGHRGPELDRAAARLSETALPSGGWAYERYLAGGHGSAPFTTAFVLGALAACASAGRGLD